MTTDRILDHVAHAAAFRAMHGVSPLAAGLVLGALMIFAALARRR